MKAIVVLLLFATSFCCSALASPPQFDSFGANDGLSMNTITDIVNDDDGYLWIATQAGINRFDGKHFKIYDTTGNQYGPSVKHIKKLRYQHKQLWLITRNDGLNHYHHDTGVFERFNNQNSELPNDIVDIDIEENGNIWVATTDKGLLYFSPTSRKIIQRFDTSSEYNRLPSNKLLCLFRDNDDRLWLGSDTGLLSIKHLQNQYEISRWGGGTINKITAIEQGNSDTLWLGTQAQGLFLLNIQNNNLIEIVAATTYRSSPISALKQDKFGTLWIGYDSYGLARYSPNQRHLHLFNSAAENRYSVNSPLITSLLIDNEQQLWIGSQGGGLNKTFLDAKYFGHIHGFSFPTDNLKNLDVRAILHDENEDLWIGTAKGVYFGLKDNNGDLSGFELFNPQNTVLTKSFISFVHQDDKGQTWIGTRGDGLFIYAQDKQSYIHYQAGSAGKNSLPSNMLYSLYFDREKRPWLTTKDAGITQYLGVEKGFKSINKTHGLPTNFISDMTQDDQGFYWLTSSTDGLISISPTGEIRHFNTESAVKLPKKSLLSIINGKDNNLWIASNDGLILFNTATLSSQLFTTEDGLIGNSIYMLLADQQHHLWLGTTKGLTDLDTDSMTTTNYTDIDGLQANEFNFGAATLGKNDTLYVGGINGLNHFNPSLLPKRQPPNMPAITKINILNQSAKNDKVNNALELNKPSLLLSHKDNIFALHYHSPNLHNANRLSYEYRMIGLNPTWLKSSSEQLTYFTGLSPGHYIFEVRAKDINNISSPIRQLKVMIEPDPWRSPFAYVFYFTLAFLLTSYLFYRKWCQYKQQAKLLNEIADSEQRLQLALRGSGDEFWDWDITKGIVSRTNTFLEYPDNIELVEETIVNLIHPEDMPKVSQVAKECINEKIDKFSISYRGLDKQGNWLWVLNRGQVVERDANGKATRLAGTVKNIQQQKETEHALRELNQQLEQRVQSRTMELQQRNDELNNILDELKHTQGELMDKEKMAALGGLVASITHEVNTPIGISVTAASHLQESVKVFDKNYQQGDVSHEDFVLYQVEVAECCKLILSNLERASKLIASFKQVSVDQSHEDVREFDLHAYLDEIFISLNPMLSRTQHKYSYSCPEKLNIKSTPGAFYQIVSNLFNNSVIHAYPDGRSGNLTLTVENDDFGIKITYQDDGCGMSDELQSQVFQPFFTTKRGKGGSGLGMNIVYNIVTQVLGGEIQIASTPEQGSTFIITLPSDLIVNR
ncbi:two-component regulator propeller domain-containing protein [Shewanella psychrotolerans]|uniref:two-component regulator propeller domain-containing protein n=1 Tax=Shewanella psychrotolerans TaxID=2864206 RepID=UPI001C65DB45|nr:two-component regulator propeller domain-containing protein [Shewanella psychrotolerans]QYK00471.1 PAS domain-containing protein [Shewanella psychrotolerans]